MDDRAEAFGRCFVVIVLECSRKNLDLDSRQRPLPTPDDAQQNLFQYPIDL